VGWARVVLRGGDMAGCGRELEVHWRVVDRHDSDRCAPGVGHRGTGGTRTEVGATMAEGVEPRNGSSGGETRKGWDGGEVESEK
jgi:hypothetical protein